MDKDMRLDADGQQKIAVINKNDIRTSGYLKTFEGGWGLTCVFLAKDDLEIDMARCKRPQYGTAFVGRRIVNHNAFHVWICLAEHGLNRRIQKPSVVEIDDDDADEWDAERGSGVVKNSHRLALCCATRLTAPEKYFAPVLYQLKASASLNRANAWSCFNAA